MSFLGALAPRLASLAAQPAVLAAGVATGVAVGAVGVGTGAIPVADPGPRLVALFECPDAARVVRNLQSNQNVLVTARSADGQWLEIYIGEAGAERGWARASSLSLKAAPDSLPVDDCTPTPADVPTELPTLGPPSTASQEPSGVPSGVPSSAQPTPTLPGPSASAAPTKTPKPTKTPGPTPTPPNGPVLTAFTLNPYPRDDLIDENPPGSGLYPIYQVGCTTGDWTVGIYIEANDPDGIASVTLNYQPTGVATTLHESMGEEGPNEYYVEIYSDSNTWGTGEVDYSITAVDGVGHSTTFHRPSNAKIIYTVCND